MTSAHFMQKKYIFRRFYFPHIYHDFFSVNNNITFFKPFLNWLTSSFLVLPEFSSKAKEMLEKMVKKDPSNFEAWNILGEQIWRQGPKFWIKMNKK